MGSFLEYLKNSPDCLYIYNRDYSIYGIPNRERYTIIVDEGWICPEEWVGFNKNIYQIYSLKQWFDIILNGELIGWECACLNKKYIIKEYVKLMMTTNPLQLRKDIDNRYSILSAQSKIDLLEYWKLIKNIKFSIQIIENHKIVNFKEASKNYSELNSITESNEFFEYINSIYKSLKELTDRILEMDRRKKLKKRE